MAKKKDRAVRLAVGYGLGRGNRRSAVWRIWVHGDEVYVSRRDGTDVLKASLHSSGRWRYGHTTEVPSTSGLDPEKIDRAVFKWDPPADYSPGNKWGLSIVFETSELRAGGFDPISDPKIKWITPAEEGMLLNVMVLIQHEPRPHDWPNSDYESWLIDKLPMKSGGVVKVVGSVLPYTPERAHERFLSAKIEFLLATYDYLPKSPYLDQQRGFIRASIFTPGGGRGPARFLDASIDAPIPSKEDLLTLREKIGLSGASTRPHRLDPFSGQRGWFSLTDDTETI